MDARSRSIFLALILTQAAHSVEEYAFGLYETFTPARLVSSLISRDLATGFIIANIALLLFGLWCYFARVRATHQSARSWAWLWVVIEFSNGIGHTVISLTRKSYFPGVVTAPVLLVLSIFLAGRLTRTGSESGAAAV